MSPGAVRRGKPASTNETSSAAYQRGDLLAGRYELLRDLGMRGAVARWVVHDIALDAQFGLKLVPNAHEDVYATEHLLREARAVARVEHPAVVRVLDFGTTPYGDPFLITDLTSGVSVRERLDAHGRLGAVDAIRLLLPIADALATAHRRGVIHRRLVPESIVIIDTERGRMMPKLLELGTSARGGSAGIGANAGELEASLAYRSPEQLNGNSEVDVGTDVWAFCVVLYEMVTGTTPFARATAQELVNAILFEPPPPPSNFGIDEPELWAILENGLRKRPEERFPDMLALGAALARWLLGHGVQEDVATQSIRAAWLVTETAPAAPRVAALTPPALAAPVAQTAPSAPPLTVDLQNDADAEQARRAALTEPCDVPKESVLRVATVMTSLVVALGAIGVGGVYASGGFGSAARHRTAHPASTKDWSSAAHESLPIASAPETPSDMPKPLPSATLLHSISSHVGAAQPDEKRSTAPETRATPLETKKAPAAPPDTKKAMVPPDTKNKVPLDSKGTPPDTRKAPSDKAPSDKKKGAPPDTKKTPSDSKKGAPSDSRKAAAPNPFPFSAAADHSKTGVAAQR